MPVVTSACPEKVSPGNVAVTLSHLSAIKVAYDRGDEVALILEDDVSFDLPWGPPHENRSLGGDSEVGDGNDVLRGGGLATVLKAIRDVPEWSLVQLGWLPEAETDGLRRLVEAWRRGVVAAPRMPCGNADWRIYGLHAYLVHRRGMEALLDAWWPGGKRGAPLSDIAAAGSLRGGFEFDLRLAGRVFSESVIMAMPGVYTVTRPLFIQVGLFLC